jgi:hypothetical protein
MPIDMLLALSLMAQPVAAAAPYTLQTCEDPVARKAMLAAGPDEFPVFKALKEGSKVNKARMTALLDRLVERAKLKPEQRAGVAMKMLEDASFKSAFAEGSVLLEKAIASMMAMTGKNDAADCRMVIGMAADLPAFEANSARQWEAMRLVMEGEAKRLGVSLAD